jgi:hypothetical protein
MDSLPKPLSPVRFRFVWKLLQAFLARRKGRFEIALERFDEAEKIMPLRPSYRVYRADVLLGAQRYPEAHILFAMLRDEFKGSDDPDLRYLRHYCTHQLSLLNRSSSQWQHEAKLGNLIDCSSSLKRWFPMFSEN